jgi:hypothetical protein
VDEFFVWAPILRTRIALRLGAQLQDVPCFALGRPSCGRAGMPCICVADMHWGAQIADVRACLAFALQTCIGAPNLRTCLVLRWGAQLADVACVAFGRPTLVRTCLSLRCGAQLADMRTCLAFPLRTCVGAPNLRTCLALRWGAQLADVPCVAFGRPSCGRALRCVGAPNLGEAVLKGLPPCQNLFLSILQLVF